MKRIFVILALLGTLLLGATAAHAAGTELSVTAPEGTLRAGESFTVTVDLSGNPGFCAAQFTLAFDQDALECTDASVGGLLQGVLSDSNPTADTGAIVAAASVDPIQGDGNLGVFQFTAKKDLTNLNLRLEEIFLTDENDREVDYTVRQQSGTAAPSQTTGTQTSGTGQTETSTGNPSEETTPSETETQPTETTQPTTTQPGEETASQPTGQPETAAPSFTDLEGHWAAEQIRAAAARGLVGGYSDGTFRPNAPVNRGQMAVMLWRLAGRPQPAGSAPFTDLGGVNEEFRTAIAWGYSTGLLNGVSDTSFAPGETLSRQAAMKLLYGRFGGQPGMETMLTATYDATFTDSGQLSAWAREPVYWAVYHGVLTGTSETTLSPRNGVTRAQLSVILMRCLERFEA